MFRWGPRLLVEAVRKETVFIGFLEGIPTYFIVLVAARARELRPQCLPVPLRFSPHEVSIRLSPLCESSSRFWVLSSVGLDHVSEVGVQLPGCPVFLPTPRFCLADKLP